VPTPVSLPTPRLRRLVLATASIAAIACTGMPSAAAARASDPDVRRAVGQIVAASGYADSASISVRDEDGDVVFAHRASESRIPASNEKLVTAFAALDLVGAEHRFETRVVRSAAIDDGVLRGDLYLVGSGDPMLSTASYARGAWRAPVATVEALARAVKAAGIRRVTGQVAGDGSRFDRLRAGPLWKPGFAGLECAPLAALGVDRNQARGRPVTRPELAAARAFRAALKRAGVRVDGRAVELRAPSGGDTVATAFSPPLKRILWAMGKDSDNFTAEMVLKDVAAKVRGRGTSAGGAVLARKSLADRVLPLAGTRIVDGSGLSPANRLTADLLTALLAEARSDPGIARPLEASLAVAGVDGTLKDRMRGGPARRVVKAKTGTLSEASALSGYAGRFSFSILVNAPSVNHWAARQFQDRIAAALAKRA
jgi:D-alanyl-D-alanine carboxypeptidase/D-alanyl-D-alanine-endopeptidase (penicillin-binding protein 4)